MPAIPMAPTRRRLNRDNNIIPVSITVGALRMRGLVGIRISTMIHHPSAAGTTADLMGAAGTIEACWQLTLLPEGLTFATSL